MTEHSMCQALAEIQEDLSEALSREEQARIEAVTEILEITNSLTNNTRASLAKEISDRQEADTALQKTIDETINTKLNKEISDRQEAVDALDSAVKDEASSRQKTDNNLQTAINEEATARQTASNALQAAIDDEASTRQEADATLQTAIASEASTRQEADSSLQAAIDAEVSARQKAINDLDVTEVGNKNTYISNISQTDGKISAVAGSIDTEVKKGSNNLVTSAAVWTAIDNLPEPMVFKGSLGTNGTKASLPSAASDNVGHTYKVITAGTYASKAAKVGDTFVSTGTTWELIPSGDEPSGTVTSVSAGTGLTTGTDPITTSGTISLATSGATAGTYGPDSAVTGTNGTTISVPKVTVDAYGRVTDISNITYTSKDTTTAYVETLTTAKTLTPTRDSTYVVTTANLTHTLNNCAVGFKVIFASTVATKINYKTPGATSNTALSMAANTVETFISTGNGYIAAKDSQMWLT